MKKYFPTTYTILSLSILFCLSISIASCKDDQPITPQEEPLPEENKPEGENNQGKNEQEQNKPITYEQFEGYMFTLDQSQKPTLGAGYEAERNVPQAKLMGISQEYKFSKDITKDNGSSKGLGFDSRLQKIGDYFFIYAKYSFIKEDDSPSKFTVLRAKDLSEVKVVDYNLEIDENTSPDFVYGVSDKKVIYGLNDSEIYTIDLDKKETKLAKKMNYDSHKIMVGQDGSILVCNGTILTKYNTETFTPESELNLPEKVRYLYQLNDDYVLGTSKKDNWLIKASEMRIIKQFSMSKDVSTKDMIYDDKAEQIFVPGKRTEKNKVYIMYLKKDDANLEEFYTIPSEDINMKNTIAGNIRLGIQPDTRDLYIANIKDLTIIRTPEVNRATREGRISRISLKEEKTLPIEKADAVEKIDDMYSFSPFVYISPSSKPAQ